MSSAIVPPLNHRLAEQEPHRRNDPGDRDRNRGGNDRLSEDARAQPSRGVVLEVEDSWHSVTIAARLLPVSAPAGRIPIASHSS
jgi:hypothetical protein